MCQFSVTALALPRFVSASLDPRQSALFILTSATELNDLSTALGDHSGTLHHTSLSDEASAALTELADDESVAKALHDDRT